MFIRQNVVTTTVVLASAEDFTSRINEVPGKEPLASITFASVTLLAYSPEVLFVLAGLIEDAARNLSAAQVVAA